MKRQTREAPTLTYRAAYALAGFISGGLISVFTVVPLCAAYLRITRPYRPWEDAWVVFVSPLVLAALVGIWGFIATDDMVETMGRWWDGIMDRYSV